MKSKVRLLAVLGVIMVGGLSILSTIRSARFHVAGFDPSLKTVATFTPSLTVHFSKPLTKNGLEIAMSPNAIKSYDISGKDLVVKLTYPMQAKTKYRFTIKSVAAESGATIKNYTASFTPKDMPYESLPAGQQKELFNNQDKDQPAALSDPIITHLPYHTLGFTLSALLSGQGANQKLTLDAEITLSHAEMSDEANAVAQYKQQITDYISSFGLDPSKYTINYTVQ